MEALSNYDKIIEYVFLKKHRKGTSRIAFTRKELSDACTKLRIAAPKNLGDIVYSYRYRKDLPVAVLRLQPSGKEWLIRPAGDAKYEFVLLDEFKLAPNRLLEKIKIPDATPGIIAKYAQSDEQALLAKLRYNRLLDLFLGAACYSLQSHLRTKVKGLGQLEIDELYVAVRKTGAHYIVPVQAKGGRDKLGRVQIEQDLAYAAERYPHLQCRSIGAQFIDGSTIALFEFAIEGQDIVVRNERHYRLVPPDQVSKKDLERYAEAEEA